MPSLESQAIEVIYHRFQKFLGGRDVDIDLHRLLMEELSSLAAEPTDVTYKEVKCPGTARPAIWCSPLSASSSHMILYMHGGGFMAGSPSSHRKMVAHLAKRVGSQALIVDYRRAPEHQFPKQIDDMVAAYRWLMEEKGFSSNHVAFAGDSAGGNLTVSVALAAKKLGLEVPAAIAAFSPWIDMRMSGDSWQTNANKDVAVVLEAMQGVVKTYLGDAPLDEPLVDLLHADLKGLPPMFLTVGGVEVLQDDSTLLAKHAKSAGVEVQLEVVEGMHHVWVFMAGNAPEAEAALSQAADFIHNKIRN
ncbi:hypothetical protein LCI18_003676 [Fusarium solani-melongenae]|uniref:Uncharacterized protein n=1 Tax=Fusarium solani subsp. cucurbitae TaxID=2747967 RepID=A0ACD3YUY2_FUSSC|nr:hypothetical protein LCI18_003676 [Fusarium solani-melongenae]